jgi:glycosyltransferase involved in cell wall biosynthesis
MPRCLLVFEPPDGGVAEHVCQLATALSSRGWAVEVAGPREAAVYPELERQGVTVVRLPIGRAIRARDYAGGLRRLVRLARSGRYDLVHVHSSKAGAIARPAARTAGIPVLYTPHCFAFIGPQASARSAAAVGVERALAHITDFIVCVAEAERREAVARRVGRPEQLRVVHNGCPDCTQTPEPDADLVAFADGRPLAACLTVLRPQKAVDTFIRAIPMILERVPDARLAVIGEGELRTELEALARSLGIGEALGFFGFKPPAPRQLASIDVFVLPSAWEAFPISILEALACGVPQVATDVGGVSEALADGETGLLCPPSDPGSLADRVARLLADPDRRDRMAQASIARHRAMFRGERMVDQIVALYEEVSRRRGAPRLSA